MLAALHDTYAAAGRPGLRQISQGLLLDDSAPATLNYQAIGKILNGKQIPSPKQLTSLAGWLLREGVSDGRSGEKEFRQSIDRLQALCRAIHQSQQGVRAGGAEVPPASTVNSDRQVEDERMLLGCMILSSDAISDTEGVIGPDDFTDDFNRRVYLALMDLYENGKSVSPEEILERMGSLSAIIPSRAAHLLHGIVAAAPEPYAGEIYSARMSKRSLAREIAAASEEVAGLAKSISKADEPDIEILSRLIEDRLLGAAFPQYSTCRAVDAIEGALDVVEALGSSRVPLGIPSGFRDLDRLNSGFQPGELVVVAGASRMGKSTLALNFLRACSIASNRPSVLVSLQFTRYEIMMRLMSAEARVALHHMTSGVMDDVDWTRLAQRMPSISGAPIHIIDEPDYSVGELIRTCRKLAKVDGVCLVVIDSIDLLFPGLEMASDERGRSLAAATRELRAMAKELDLVVIAFYQLGRVMVDHRGTPRPELHHIPWVLESAADIVILLHREDAYELDTPRAGEADFFIAKSRTGPSGVIVTAFQGHYARFVDMSES
ncbi:replicative DNA helicase [Streptomyces sp. NPDC059355]|uniref:replicative DNA helicase n=1 Tax=Streptomyces sp. NPDC059355 TaxID=3346811 RepID=UPI0036CF8A0C